MGSKRIRVRQILDDDGGRLPTAFRRIVARFPFLHVKEQEQLQQREEEEEENRESHDLCQRCKELDLDSIFKSPDLSENMVGSEKALTLGFLEKDSPCALCRFFYSMRRQSRTGTATESYHLQKYPLDRYHDGWRFGNLTWAVEPDGGYPSHTSLSVIGMYDRPQPFLLPQFTEPCPYPKDTSKGLPVSETSVNYPLLRRWIKECEGHPDCSYFSTDPTESHIRPIIRVIDCITRHIVNLQPGDRYIALSYVWGRQPLLKNKSSRVLPTNAPKVIEDALVVVKELGQQYLWVDQYCIDQHDNQDKHAQIRNMDRIYAGSHATVVAFSGVDSSSGLPGVSSIPRIPQLRFTSSKVTLLGFTPYMTRYSFEASTWVTRGWTFQEALLSRRLLVFTQEQVYFLCSRGSWVESCNPTRHMIWENPKWNAISLHLPPAPMELISPLAKMPVDKFGYQLRVNIGSVLNLIRGFSWRQLSFQSDALNAVRGLLSRVPVLTYWGMPVYDLLESRQGVFAFDALEANAAFLQGLLWRPDGTATDEEYLGRREGFPSWSWLGWRTPVNFAWLDTTFNRVPHCTVKIESADGTLLSIHDLVEPFGAEVERSRMLPERTTYMWLEGLVLKLGFQPVGNSHDGGIHFCINHPLGYSDHLKCSCLPKNELQGTRADFRLNVKGSEDISKRTLKRKWSCLLIFYVISKSYHFLILDEGDDAAYCVGTLRLMEYTGDENLLEELTAKVPHEYRKVRIG